MLWFIFVFSIDVKLMNVPCVYVAGGETKKESVFCVVL